MNNNMISVVISVISTIVTLLMTIGTFRMAVETFPTFICTNESGGMESAGWIIIRIHNRGSSAAYDVAISLNILSYTKKSKGKIIKLDKFIEIRASYGGGRYFPDKIEYWPTSAEVSGTSHFPDNYVIKTKCFNSYVLEKNGMRGTECTDLTAEIVITYTDHLKQ